jgi:hypothetical protein
VVQCSRGERKALMISAAAANRHRPPSDRVVTASQAARSPTRGRGHYRSRSRIMLRHRLLISVYWRSANVQYLCETADRHVAVPVTGLGAVLGWDRALVRRSIGSPRRLRLGRDVANGSGCHGRRRRVCAGILVAQRVVMPFRSVERSTTVLRCTVILHRGNEIFAGTVCAAAQRTEALAE